MFTRKRLPLRLRSSTLVLLAGNHEVHVLGNILPREHTSAEIYILLRATHYNIEPRSALWKCRSRATHRIHRTFSLTSMLAGRSTAWSKLLMQSRSTTFLAPNFTRAMTRQIK